MKTITLPYWGQIIGLVSQKTAQQNNRSLFITRYQQAHTAVLYILDNKGEQFDLTSMPLPCAMQAITKIGDHHVVMIGQDGHLYQTDWQAKKIEKVSPSSLLETADNLDSASVNNSVADPAVAMAALHNAIIILYPNQIVVWPYQDNQASAKVLIKPFQAPFQATETTSSAQNIDTGSNRATALATSSDGKWVVIGDQFGFVSSYQWLGDNLATSFHNFSEDTLSLSSRHRHHQGKVSAICFEPIGQYFFSAGADKNLYRTHVQGDLHPIDRAKSSQHSQMITALCVSKTRLFSAADDKSIKSWSFDKGQPNTCKEDLTKSFIIKLSSYAENPALISVGTDQSLRFIPIDIDNAQNGKLLPVAYIIKDGYQRVSQLLTDRSNNSDTAFKEGLLLLQSHADSQTLEVVSRLLSDKGSDKNATLTASQALQLVQWIATTQLDKTTAVLEQQLQSARSSQLRLAAFHALANRASTATRPLQYLEYALKSRYEEIVASALQGYLKAAMNAVDSQRRIVPIIQNALSHSMPHIRKQALTSLEILLPSDSPKADLMALDCHHPDIIQAGLIRLYQRDMLTSLEVSRQLMLLQNHHNTDVRQTAFYVSVLSRPELVSALKQQASQQGDTQLMRTLTDFDDFRLLRGTLLDNAETNKDGTNYVDSDSILSLSIGATTEVQNDTNSAQTKRADSANNQSTSTAPDDAIHLALSTQDFISQTNRKTTKQKAQQTKTSQSMPLDPITLSNDSLEPLLQNLGNRYEDISFRAAYALACLQDRRAFGTLIMLMHHEKDAVIRAGVATALGHLNLEDGKAVLPVLLDDADAGVRQVAMKAFGQLADNVLSWVAVGFASKHQDIHEQSLALFLSQTNVNSVTNSADNPVKPSKNNEPESTQLSLDMTAILQQTLNNPFTSIRLEVVKVLLNREFEHASEAAIINVIGLLQQSLFEDVHQVAIEEWQHSLMQIKSKSQSSHSFSMADDINQSVLTLLFADTFIGIRQQAFDTALKNAKRLSFITLILSALASPYLDIKKLALTTLQTKASISQLKEIMPALVGMLADDSIELRQQALKVALSLTNLQPISLASFDTATIERPLLTDQDDLANNSNNAHANNDLLIKAALDSPYPDIQLTVAQLIASQSRLQADNNNDTQHNDEQAYAVFKRYLDIAMPAQAKTSDGYTQWHHHVTQALLGLAQLSDPSKYDALSWYAKYLHHPDANFSQLAPQLMEIVTLDDADVLATWQKDERPIISQSASLALAVWGDTRGQYFFTKQHTGNFNNSSNNNIENLVEPITPINWLQAQHGLSITHARQLRPLFESQSYVAAARLLLIFNDLQHQQRPHRLIEALSFADNETAVVYANILARYPVQSQDLQPVWDYLSDYLSRKVGAILSAHSSVVESIAHGLSHATTTPATKGNKGSKVDSIRATVLTGVSADTLAQLARLSDHAQPLIRAQTITIIGHLSELLEYSAYDSHDKVLATLQAWQRNLQALLNANNRSQSSIDSEISDVPTTTTTTTTEIADGHNSYQTLAFGAWLGVICASDDYYSNNHTTDQAIRGLMWLATQPNQADSNQRDGWQDSVSCVLLPLLNHNNFDTRELAWDCLYTLNVPTKKLAEYAMSTTYSDMVKRGLHLLLKSIENNDSNLKNEIIESNKVNSAANQQLIGLLKTNNISLAEAAYQLLKERLGLLQASLLGLNTYCYPLLHQIVGEWQQTVIVPFAQTQSDPKHRQDKLTFLMQASNSNDWQTRYLTFTQLVDFHDVLFSDITLLDALFEFWKDSQTATEQSQVLPLIVSVLESYKPIKNAIDLTDDDRQHPLNSSLNSLDISVTTVIADTAYSQLLGLLDYPQLSLSKARVYEAIAGLRDAHMVAPLLQRLQHYFTTSANLHKIERQQIFDTIVTVSGYDQSINDYLEEREDKRWLQRQHPRHPQVLLSLFNILMGAGDYDHAAQLLASLSWAKDTDVEDTNIENHVLDANTKDSNENNSSPLSTRIDSALTLAYEQMPVNYTLKLVQTLAYRAKRRHGSLTSLQKALSNKEADVQFLAAEGLAKCGSAEGLNILMATIDYNADGNLRRRSVLAIGELMGHDSEHNRIEDSKAATTYSQADQNAQAHTLYQAYDKLIKLAEDDEHYLQDVASEALGRLAQGGDFECSQRIFELLKSHLTDPNLLVDNPAIIRWLNGLRWLDTLPAWEQIRQYIRRYLHQTSLFEPQIHAIHLLQFSDNDANKTLLLDILQNTNADNEALTVAYAASQKIWGSQSSQVYLYDWAAAQNHNDYFAENTERLSIKRIVNHSTIDELTMFITQHGLQLPSATLVDLQNAIMARQDMSKLQLVNLINSHNALIQHIGLRYLTQYPSDYMDNDMIVTLHHRFDTAKDQWHSLIDVINNSPMMINNERWINSVEQVGSTIKYLVWLNVRYLPTTKDSKNFKQVVESIASYLPGAKNKTKMTPMFDTIDWLNTVRQRTIIDSISLLAVTVSEWWQQALLALLARPISDDNFLLDLVSMLKSVSVARSQQLSYDNQALLNTVIARFELNDKYSVNKQADAIEISVSQQLLLWIKTKDVVALYACANDDSTDISMRIRAIEALGQQHNPKIGAWLDSLMTDEDVDIQKLAYKVLRRWQRAMNPAQQKRPLAVALMNMQDSPENAAYGQETINDDN